MNASNDLLLVDVAPGFQAAAIVRNGIASPLPLPAGYSVWELNGVPQFALDDLGRALGALVSGTMPAPQVGTRPTFQVHGGDPGQPVAVFVQLGS